MQDKQTFVNDLTEELEDATEEANPDEMANTTQQLRQARADLVELQRRLTMLAHEDRRINQ
nr:MULTISPECIES: hypothetical protein [Pseudomonas syringae group genomosp. 2]